MKLTATPATTVTWCGTVKECLTDVEKAILFHEHEAKRNRFFGMMKQEEYHTYMVGAIKRMAKYSELTRDVYAQVVR
ncbi:MAG: hypothetical protein ACRCTP_04710 [Aeromonas popoffii]|uniref:hypothetical protein n=1 Tax=Aeromonas popoffii TaxID=70856 RepID=UPI003F3C52EB